MSVKLFPVLLLLVNLISSINGDYITDPCINQTSLCFGIPFDCPTHSTFTCEILVRFTSSPFAAMNPDLKDEIEVQLYANPKGAYNKWFALGLSEENKMGNDFLVHCNIDSTGAVTIGEAVTTGGVVTIDEAVSKLYSKRHVEPGSMILDSTTSSDSNVVNCKWTLRATGGAHGPSFDIRATKYYLLLAQGPIVNGEMVKHSVKTISSAPVYLSSTDILLHPSRVPILVKLGKLHGSLLSIAWLCFVSTAIVVFRHKNKSWAESTQCRVKIWVVISKALIILTILYNVIALISMFSHFRSLHRHRRYRPERPEKSEKPAIWLGLMAFLIVYTQPMVTVITSANNEPKLRHLIKSSLALLVTVLTVYIVSSLELISLSSAFVSLLAIFVLFHVIIQALIHIHPILSSQLEVTQDVSMGGLEGGSTSRVTGDGERKFERFKQIVVIIYFVGVHLVGIALVSTVLTTSPK